MALLAVLVAAAVVAAVVSVPWLRTYFAPGYLAGGEVFQRLDSRDGHWRVLNYDVTVGRLKGSDYSRGDVVDLAGSRAVRTVYAGPLATISWLGDRVVFTEEASGARHVIALPAGTYDERVDDRLNLIGTLLMMAAPVLLVLCIGLFVVFRLGSRRGVGT